MIIDLRKMDWKLLRKQKAHLVKEIETSENAKSLIGILHLIDHIQDEAAKKLDDNKIFKE